jgi:hypothetical protein
VAGAGFLAAAVSVPWLLLGLPLATGELERAEELGLISATVRAGYPESQELVVYLWFTLLAPILAGALAARWVLPRARAEDARRWPGWVWVALGGALALLALDVGYVTSAGPWGRFGFLGEEGVYLGTAAGLRAGGALYRDLAFSYGPLMGWPVPLALGLAGDEIIGYRVLVWVCNLVGLFLIVATLRLLVRSPVVALVAFVGAALLALPVLPNLNATTLRLALGVFAVTLVGSAVGGANRRPVRLVLGGAAAGLAMGFSFEVGLAAFLAAVAALSIPVLHRHPPRTTLGDAALVACGAGLTLVPMVVVLAARGELVAFATTLRTMVDLPGAGYQALPWPDLLGWFRDAAGQHRPFPPSGLTYLAPGEPGHGSEVRALIWWASVPWIVLALGVTAAATRVFAIARQPREGSCEGTAMLVGLVLFGVIVGRGAVGRSDLYHLQFYGALPAVLVGAALVDGWLVGGSWLRSRRGLGALAMLLVLVLSIATWPPGHYAPDDGRSLWTRVGVASPHVEAVDRPRARGIRLDPELAAEVRAVVDWAGALPAARTVWFYPSEATYTWLTARPPVTSYPWAYDAATRAQRVALVESLEAQPPDCVLVTEGTFSIDHIPGDELLPEIEAWIDARYEPSVVEIPGATVLRHRHLPPDTCTP